MQRRTVYAHWLDPEYTSFRWPDPVVKRRLRYIFEVLKLRAIMGDAIYVSDVQITDSRALLELFCDKEFVRCMKARPDFLRLVAIETDDLGASDQRLKIIESSLVRTLGPTWRSSTFRDAEVPKDIARHVQKQRPADAEAFADALEKFTPSAKLPDADKRFLGGMIEALKYFATATSQVSPAKPPGSSNTPRIYYDDVLKKAEADPKLTPHFRRSVRSTLKFMGKAGRRNTHRRAPVVSALEEAGLDNIMNYMHLSHVIQAWNLAVAGTVQAGGQDVPRFWRAVPIPALQGSIGEVTVPGVNATIVDQDVLEGLSHHWHPADISWAQIALVRRNCAAAIEAFQLDQTAALRRSLLKCAGKVIAESGTSSPSLLLSTEGGLAGELFGQIRKGSRFIKEYSDGIPPLVRLGAEVGALLLAPALSAPVDIGDWLLQCAEREFRRRESNQIAENIESQMVRYNLLG